MPRESKDRSILSILEQLTKANGSEDSEMATALNDGPMGLFILDSGIIIEHKVKVNLYILTVMCMKATG